MPGWQKAALAVGGSVLLHVIAAFLLGQAARFRPAPPPQKPVEVSVVEVQKPKPPEPPPPPRAPVKKPPPQPVVHVLKPPKTVEPPSPPPPNQQPKPDEKPPDTPPVVLPGVTLESTSDKGSFSVNTGNTLYGKPDTKGHDPSDVHPYKAQKYVPAARLSTPVRISNAESVNVRKYYPPEATKADLEGDVVVRIMVDFDGSVVKATALTDPGLGLGAAAVVVVKEAYKFEPATLDGEPVATTTTIVIHFTLNN